MKKFRIFYAKYPFNMDTLSPKSETVEADSLEDAIQKMKDKYGNSIEIFERISKEI